MRRISTAGCSEFFCNLPFFVVEHEYARCQARRGLIDVLLPSVFKRGYRVGPSKKNTLLRHTDEADRYPGNEYRA